MKRIFLLLLKIYQTIFSPFFYVLGVRCRFHPSCSEYSMMCFAQLSVTKAFYYTLKRVLRCQPLCSGGIDMPPTIPSL